LADKLEFSKTCCHQLAAELTQEIEAELTRFRGESSPEDDHNFVIVKVL
jgi:hypothetical protein